MKGDPNQEWMIVEKLLKSYRPTAPPHTAFSTALVQQTLCIENMSLKFLLPSLINLLDAEVLVPHLKKTPLVRYEELFYISNWLLVNDTKALIPYDPFSVVLHQFTKSNRILRILNQFRARLHDIQVESAIVFYTS